MGITSPYQTHTFWKNYWKEPVSKLEKQFLEDSEKDSQIISVRHAQKRLTVISALITFVILSISFYYSTDFFQYYYSEKNPIFAERFSQDSMTPLIALYQLFFVGMVGGTASYIATWLIGLKNIQYKKKLVERKKQLLMPEEEKAIPTSASIHKETQTLFYIMSHNSSLAKKVRERHEQITEPFVDHDSLKRTLFRIINQKWSTHDMYVFANAVNEIDLQEDYKLKKTFFKTGQQLKYE